ncbi:MAG TPA: hypothetical protein VFN67_27585 [Polyangiales bacterium]|nr:hypothetical protein [Polyangiales bacterium]
MESVIWNLRTLDDFVLGAPLVQLVMFVLVVFWDYPLLVVYFLFKQVVSFAKPDASPITGEPLPVLVIIPSMLRKRDELTSMMATVRSIANNGYPGPLLIVLSIDGTNDSPPLYAALQRWAMRQWFNSECTLRVTGTAVRRSKPMAIHHGMEYVQKMVANGTYPAFPPVYVSTDADADLGPNALSHIVGRLQQRNPITGAPTRVVAGALHVRGNEFWRGWRRFFTIPGQLNLQVAREYYVSNVSRHNIRWLPLSGIPGAFYCTWSGLFLAIAPFMGYMQTLQTRHWLKWWFGVAPPKFSESAIPPHPERIAGDTDDTVTAYIAMIARYEDGAFTLDPPRTPLHAFIAMLRGLTVERAIQYEPRARVFTTSPTTIRSLMKQRKRWNTARIEVTGRLWRALGYHWTLGFTAACVMLFMARSVLFGVIAYLAIPVALVHEYLLTGFILAYLTHVFISGLLTVLALLVGNELKYWRLLLAVPLTPVYGFWFKWLPGAWGWVSDVLLFGNRTGFAPEATLIKGGSVRIALLFRIRRFFSLLVRALTHGDVPLGSFWFGWGETPWTPSGYEGFTSNKKRRSILPPFKRSPRRG